MRTHLLHHEPPGQRVADCGAVEDLQITERMSFTIDPQYVECEGCRVVGILRTHLPIELPDEGQVLCMCGVTCKPYTIRG